MKLPPANFCGSAETIKGQVVGIETWLKHVKTRHVCVQAGGNIGYFPLELARHFESVHTFEPEPINFECLQYNCEKISNIKFYKAALGEKGSMSGLHYDDKNIGAHYLEGEGDIKVKTIDDLNLPEVNLIALDVEGYEWQALKGAVNMIKRDRPTIVIEMKDHGKRYGYSDKDMVHWLTDLGYADREKVFRDHIWTCNS